MMRMNSIEEQLFHPRRSRFTRSDPPPLQLTDDDLTILRHVAEHRFLRSTHIVDLLQRPRDKIVRRLGVLFHNGFLDRPRAQLNVFAHAGSAPLVYALGNKAVFEGDRTIDWTDKNRDVKRPYIEHALSIADFMVAIECAARDNPAVSLLAAQDITAHVRSWTLSARVPGMSAEIAVAPDKVFGLEFTDSGRCNYFLVEADRSTMPIERRSPDQSSFKKKLLAYHHAHEAGQHTALWGIPGFRVLTLARSAERIASMIDTVYNITGGKGSNVFLFAEVDKLKGYNPLAFPWLSGKGHEVRLVS